MVEISPQIPRIFSVSKNHFTVISLREATEFSIFRGFRLGELVSTAGDLPHATRAASLSRSAVATLKLIAG